MNPMSHEMLMLRFRHIMIDSGVEPPTVTNAELLRKLKPATWEDKLAAMKILVSIVPEHYWREVGL